MSLVMIISLPYHRKRYLLVPQCDHYCLNGVVIQALTGIQAQDVSETTPIA